MGPKRWVDPRPDRAELCPCCICDADDGDCRGERRRLVLVDNTIATGASITATSTARQTAGHDVAAPSRSPRPARRSRDGPPAVRAALAARPRSLGPRFVPARYEVATIDEAQARPFIETHHYAHSYPVARFAYGLNDTWCNTLVGVAVYAVPVNAAVLTTPFPGLEPYVESIELSRLVLLDEVPFNAETERCRARCDILAIRSWLRHATAVAMGLGLRRNSAMKGLRCVASGATMSREMGQPRSALTLLREHRVLSVQGSAAQFLEGSVRHLDVPSAVFEAMLGEFDRQQASRGLAVDTRRGRERLVRQLRAHADAWPWDWTPAQFESFSADHLRRGRTRSTVRGYQNAIVAFCAFVCDARYGWPQVCEQLFDAVPSRVAHELNTLRHKGDYEGRPEGNRPLSRDEQDAFFSTLDKRVTDAARSHRKGAVASLRDAFMFLAILGWGLRRTEAAGLDVDDFRRNAKTPQFGGYGALVVRNAKAFPGGPPRRRTVLTTYPWAADAASQWVDIGRPACYPDVVSKVLLPTERGRRIVPRTIDQRFAIVRDAAGLPAYLNPHCLRHTYATSLIESGWPMQLVREQMGHTHVATTAIYTALSDDFKDRMLYASLGIAWAEPPATGPST